MHRWSDVACQDLTYSCMIPFVHIVGCERSYCIVSDRLPTAQYASLLTPYEKMAPYLADFTPYFCDYLTTGANG
jgi:hypothetical protein